MASEPVPTSVYLRVYLTLMVLFIITFSLSFVDLGRYWNNSLAEGIACVKALLIVLFFMNVRYEFKITWFFAAAGALWLALMLTVTTGEYLTRNHPQGVNPKGEPVYLLPRPMQH